MHDHLKRVVSQKIIRRATEPIIKKKVETIIETPNELLEDQNKIEEENKSSRKGSNLSQIPETCMPLNLLSQKNDKLLEIYEIKIKDLKINIKIVLFENYLNLFLIELLS